MEHSDEGEPGGRSGSLEGGTKRAPRVGLVLGGGGVIGLAYHAGALAAVEHDLRWDPRQADLIVGTSAGALTGALLRLGVPAGDLAAMTVGATTLETPTDLQAGLAARPQPPPFRLRSVMRRPRSPGWALLARWTSRPWLVDPLGALISFVPDGTIDLVAHTASLDAALPIGWPDRPLWLTAVSRHDLRRRVFGRDVTAPLGTAVAASCAVPGMFTPVRVGRYAYLDGGVHSPSNADVLVESGRGIAPPELDLAIVVSPMSGRGLHGVRADAVVRRRSRAKLQLERARLGVAGLPSLVLEPGPEVQRHLGLAAFRTDRLVQIVQAGFLDAGGELRRAANRALVALLGGRAPPASVPPPADAAAS